MALGLALQRLSSQERLRDAIWVVSFWVVVPALVFAVFLHFKVSGALVLAIISVVVATYIVIGIGYLYARAVTSEKAERGALMLGSSFGSTGPVGFPIARLLFGHQGLELAVVYDQLAFGVPISSLSTVIARLHGNRTPDVTKGSRVAAILFNPPLYALIAALCLRFSGVGVPGIGALSMSCLKWWDQLLFSS